MVRQYVSAKSMRRYILMQRCVLLYHPVVSLECQYRFYIYIFAEYILSMQLFQFDNEVYIYLFRAQFLHQFAGCFHCSARSQKVVVQQYYIVRFNGILVDLYRIFAVLFVVASSIVSAGSFPGLRMGTNPAPKRVARMGPMMKPLDSIPTTLVIPLSLYISYKVSESSCSADGFFKQSGYIVE